MFFKYDDDYHPRCLVKLKNDVKKSENEFCLICKDAIFIQYDDHPGLHSTCYETWKTTNEGEYPFSNVVFNAGPVLENLRTMRAQKMKEKQETFLIIDEDTDHIQRILTSCKDYYEVLQVMWQIFFWKLCYFWCGTFFAKGCSIFAIFVLKKLKFLEIIWFLEIKSCTF